MRRVAPAIAEGRVDLLPEWRTDTPEGRRVEFWGTLVARVFGTLLLVVVAASVLMILGTLIFVLTVD
ncbi:hypothetical protein [Streptomyces sp. NPDC097619]|uniref:hypothetical protein n=1 Tax=Streptomyces sp. NPDC097619 TaxID=3157228 RepID=UPI00332D8B05